MTEPIDGELVVDLDELPLRVIECVGRVVPAERPARTALEPPAGSPLHPSRYDGPLRWVPDYPVDLIRACQLPPRRRWWRR